ncbi:beta strand repeat-containing protein [Candidatus Amarolinea aalborgensis]|uniref:beta strand repeat-containing protein n=1 Tax=Candidatus Amarolinea aalborgensis TaxID=2249329 RepID=UPI003BF9E1AF
MSGQVPALVIDNTTNAKNALAVAQTNIWRNLTVNTGTKLDANGFFVLMLGPAVTNNGSIVGTVTNSRFDFQGASAQTYSGSGTFGTAAAPFLSVGIFNGSGVTLSAPIVTNRVNLFWGTFINSNQFTLGNGGASSTTVQIGQASATTPGGNFDVSPTYSTGSGGHSILYLQETVVRTTGFEIPGTRSVASVTINNTNGVTLAGGNLTITGASGFTLTAGLFNTSAANTPTLATTVTTIPTGSATSYVNGPLAIQVNSASNVNRTFGVGNSTGWRPIVISNFHSNGVLQTYTAEVITGPTGGTPVSPLAALTLARYVRIQNTANIFSTTTATVQLSYGTDDNVGNLPTARVAEANTASGSYTSRGGSTQASPTTGIASTTAIVQGDDYFVLANEQSLPITWDGGASTSNWGDANNWNPDGVPTGTSNVTLASASATTINVNGAYAVNNLTLANSITLNLGSNTLTVNGAFSQSGGTIDLGSGTLEVRGDFAKTGGTFTPNTGTVLLSGAAARAVNCTGVTFYNLNLQNGGAGNAKTFTAGVTCTINNDFAVGSTAQLALSAATATTFNVAGNLNYGGVAGGANVGSLTLNLTGVGKTIGGAALEAPALAPAPDYSRTPVQEVSFLTDASRFVSKDAVQLENTYAQRQADVERLLAAKSPDSLLIINLDDCAIVQNPAWVASLAPTAAPSFEMNVTVASGAGYTLQDNVTMGAARTLNVIGRLDAGAFTIGGAGLLNLSATTSILGTAKAAGGVGATVLTTGANTYVDGSIVEYNAAGDQTIDATTHPPASMIQTGGSGTKTLNGNKTISGSSGVDPTKGMIYVKAGTTFADGGYTISGTSSGYDNVVVYGAYLSTGSGAISFESGPFSSKILAVNATIFGDLKMNFSSSTYNIYLQADTSPATSNVTFRNLTFGGTAGTGTAGGTLTVNYLGTTPVVVNGNVSLAPPTLSNTGGGFGGTTATNGTVTVKGNITSASTATTQPIFNNTGANTLVMGGTAAQTIDVVTNVTILTGATLRIANGADVALAPTSGSGRAYKLGGTLTVDAGGAFGLGQNTLTVETAVTNNGTIKQVRDVTSASQFDFVWLKNAAGSTTYYYGVSVTPASAMGLTTVSIRGNQKCPQITSSTIKRCYEVTPTSVQTASIKFYFSEPEMTPTGQPLANQNVWNYHTSAWNAVTRGTDSGTCNTAAINCFVEGTGIANYSPFAASPSVPLAAVLADFSAAPNGNAIRVTWETVSEVGNIGFNLWRGDAPGAPDTQLNASLIPSQAPGSSQGFVYTFDDANVVSGMTYYYWVETVDTQGGVSRFGPVSATFNAPTAVSLSDFAPLAALPLAWPLAVVGLAALAGMALLRRRTF